MPKRRHICDVPNCGRERQSWQRLCQRCFDGLSFARRRMITSAFHSDKPRWRRERNQAAVELGLKPAARVKTIAVAPDQIAARRSFELQQRILGERPDA